MKRFWAALCLAAVCACSQNPSENPSEIVEADPAHAAMAETLVPADPGLAAVYERSCRTCHALDGMGAPLTGHAAAWAPRLEARGMDGMLASVHTGRGVMPPMGYCADCTDETFTALIEFMSTEGQP